MKNQIIRSAAADHGVFLWEVADVLGITDSSFSRRLRHELPEEETSRILSIIKSIDKERSTLPHDGTYRS